MPPPSSGGVHVIQMLNILEGYDLKKLGQDSADTIHRLVEAMRRAYADRAKFLGDPDFVQVPVAGLTNKAYAAELRKSINLEHATKSADVSAGKPPSAEGDQTTHFSVMDKAGNAVANTFTLNLAFGSGYTVDGAGFFLNNEMDDFSAKAGAPNAYGLVGDEANAIEPRKRPLSSMAPTIVLKDGAPYSSRVAPARHDHYRRAARDPECADFRHECRGSHRRTRVHHQWQPDNVITERGISDDTSAFEARGFILPKTSDGAYQHRVLGRANSVAKKGGLFMGAADMRDGDGAAIGY